MYNNTQSQCNERHQMTSSKNETNVKRTIDILLHLTQSVVCSRLWSRSIYMKLSHSCESKNKCTNYMCSIILFLTHSAAMYLWLYAFGLDTLFGSCKLHITRLMSLFVRLFIYLLIIVTIITNGKSGRRIEMSAMSWFGTTVACPM